MQSSDRCNGSCNKWRIRSPNRELRTENRGPWTVDRGPRTVDRGPRTVNRGPWTADRGPWTVDRIQPRYGPSKTSSVIALRVLGDSRA